MIFSTFSDWSLRNTRILKLENSENGKASLKNQTCEYTRGTQGRCSESGKVPPTGFYILTDYLGKQKKLKLSL